MAITTYYEAILLIGATGSGKTPLGDLCEQKGLWGRSCLHFDFGEQLRSVAGNSAVNSFLSGEDVSTVTRSLKTGKLLEKKDFHIAVDILEHFIREKGAKTDVLLVMNGLPRHLSQAEDVRTMVDVKMLVYLDCSPEVIGKRIALNSGGDRTGRIDDSLSEIRMKLRLFRERTLPLIDYYRSIGIRVEQIPVAVESTAEMIHRRLNDIKLFAG
jgi:adenylate kinase